MKSLALFPQWCHLKVTLTSSIYERAEPCNCQNPRQLETNQNTRSPPTTGISSLLFLAMSSACLGAGHLGAIEPFERQGDPKLLLGLAAYSFRKKMKWVKGKPNAEA
ncbi:MAG: hypothetical protein ACJAVK_000149 [Akkermansiaceae bacterium]|jgi:hypothetical protein